MPAQRPRPRGCSASPRSARGSSSARRARTPSSSSSAIAALGDHHRIDDDAAAGRARAMAAATASTIAAVASMPVLVAWIAMSPATASICAVTRSAGSGSDRGDADGVLRGDRGDRARAVHAERRERLQIGLDAGAAARVAAGDGQRRSASAAQRTRSATVSLPKTSRRLERRHRLAREQIQAGRPRGRDHRLRMRRAPPAAGPGPPLAGREVDDAEAALWLQRPRRRSRSSVTISSGRAGSSISR